jgi:hypothetical protein
MLKLIVLTPELRDALMLVNWENHVCQLEPFLLKVNGTLQWCIGADVLQDTETWGNHLAKLQAAGKLPEPVEVDEKTALVQEVDENGNVVNHMVQIMRLNEVSRLQAVRTQVLAISATAEMSIDATKIDDRL